MAHDAQTCKWGKKRRCCAALSDEVRLAHLRTPQFGYALSSSYAASPPTEPWSSVFICNLRHCDIIHNVYMCIYIYVYNFFSTFTNKLLDYVDPRNYTADWNFDSFLSLLLFMQCPLICRDLNVLTVRACADQILHCERGYRLWDKLIGAAD